MQRITAKARVVCWTKPKSWLLTLTICDLPIRVWDAAVALLRLGRSLALPTRETSFLNTTSGCPEGAYTIEPGASEAA